MGAAIHAFAEDLAPASRLADALGLTLRQVDLHRFPDGESLPTVAPGDPTVLVYRSLDRPDAKLVPLLLACDAWRRNGARRLVLVAPYLPYLRQDKAFRPGQPLSRDVVGSLLGERFDRIVTVEPHLHRTRTLDGVFNTPVTCLSSAAPLAGAFQASDRWLVVGPDVEAEPWARSLADELRTDFACFRKQRLGDAAVDLRLDEGVDVQARRVLLVDDICSSGATLALAASILQRRGAAHVEVAVAHALFDAKAGARLRDAAVARVVSTDSCAHSTNAVELAPLLAAALQDELR
jgi:ribose-phosphate pyrophosphokinase